MSGNEFSGDPGKETPTVPSGQQDVEATSPIEELKAVILALEWEITEQTLENFQKQVNGLEDLWKTDPACVIELRILRGLGNHVDRAKSDVHPQTLNMIFEVFRHLEQFFQEEMAQARKNEIANEDLKGYQELRLKLGTGETGAAAGKIEQPQEKMSSEEVVSTMSGEERKEQGEAGGTVQPALANTGSEVDRADSEAWKTQESFKEVEDRLDDFFAEDDSGKSDAGSGEEISPSELSSEELGPPEEPAGEPAQEGDFVDEVGGRLDEFFAEDAGVVPPAGEGILEGEVPMDFGDEEDDTADFGAATPSSMSFEPSADTRGAAEAPVQATPQPPRKPEDTPINGLKGVVEGVDARIDQQTLQRLDAQIQAFGAACKEEPGLRVLLHLLDSSARSLRMLGKKTLPGSVELFRSLYASLEDLYVNRVSTGGPGFDVLAGETAKYTDLQNKLVAFLISTLVKREKQMITERKTTAGLKQQLEVAKVAAAKAAEQHESALAVEREGASRLKQQVVQAQVEKDKAVNELQALRQEIAKQTEAAASAGFLNKLKRLFSR